MALKLTNNYYSILDVPQNATQSEIRKAYRQRALKVHPDKNDTAEATQEFQQLVQAYETLRDEDKRRNYDRSLKNPTATEHRSTPRPAPRPTSGPAPGPTPQPEETRQHSRHENHGPNQGTNDRRASVCDHCEWWSREEGPRRACPQCQIPWTFLLKCPGCGIMLCPPCKSKVQGQGSRRQRAPRRRSTSPVRSPLVQAADINHDPILDYGSA